MKGETVDLAKAAQPVEAVDVRAWDQDHAERIRPSFEAWAKSKSFYMGRALPSISTNGYSDRATDWAFRAWAFATLAHPRPTGDAIAEVAIVGWAWLLVDERTGRDYGRGFSWGEAKPDIPSRAGTHYDYRALIGREKAIAASGDCNAFIHSDRGLLHDLGAHVVVDVVDVEQQAAPLVQEVPVRGARLSGDEGLTAPTGEKAGEVAWTKKAAEFIEKKAQSYADEFGRDDMGSISFGAGRGADKMEEYWMSLIDLAEDFRKLGGKCQVPPDGWECSRAVGHDGPCAASPAAEPDGEVG